MNWHSIASLPLHYCSASYCTCYCITALLHLSRKEAQAAQELVQRIGLVLLAFLALHEPRLVALFRVVSDANDDSALYAVVRMMTQRYVR